MGTETDEILRRYLDAIRSSPHNLVSRRGLEELEGRHLAESVTVARALPLGPAAFVDVGTGGGFPGFVVAVLRPDLDVTLVDATAKKVRFLRETAERLGVRASIVRGRIEELARGELAGSFDLATARAVAPLHRLVPWTMPLLRPGGELWAIKGGTWAEELAAAEEAIRTSGGEVLHTPADSGTVPSWIAGGATGAEVRVVIIARRGGDRT
jgi:16S rRNA (guanine527-N7)-methyltransferase